MDTMRLRVVFDDRHILNQAQKSEGLKRSWILLKPELETISDVASHIAHAFDLHHSCPNGLRISMDGFVLPPFESTHFFKDKDIIRVKRKEGAAIENIQVGEEEKSAEDSEDVEKQPVLTGVKLLALEEFERETGGYQSEPEEIEYDSPENTLHLVTPPSGKTTTKKRKSSKTSHSSKRKRIKPTLSEKSIKVSVKSVEDDTHLENQSDCLKGGFSQKSSHKDKSSKTSIKSKKARSSEVGSKPTASVKHKPAKERCDNLQENGKLAVDVPEGTKKGPSRSARRKKAKRKWLSELKSQNKELAQSIPDKAVYGKSQEHQASKEKADTEAEIVPILVRPGHIRFEPLDEDGAVQQAHRPLENFQWKGITSKKKGQKWGMEKASVSWSNGHEHFGADAAETDNLQWNDSTSKRNRHKWATENTWGTENTSALKSTDDEDREDTIEKQNVEERELVVNPADFEKLNPLHRPPKEGDVVAYRLVELSSEWCPELSAFRVGKVSWFDTTSNTVMLVPVPGYPIVSDEKRDDEETALESDVSLYFEDGSLEIDFASLVDVRIFNHDHSKPETAATDGSKEAPAVSSKEAPVSNKGALSCAKSNDKNEETHVKTTGNGDSVDVWEEVSQVLNEKKTQLSREREDSWSEKEKSGKSLWSYRAMRSSALGPTMALLRAGNGL